MKKISFLLIALCLFVFKLQAEVTDVDYRIVFNETTEEYDCYLHIVAGSAVSVIERAQFTSAFILVTPRELTIDNITSVSPGNNIWNLSQTISEPANNPDFNYYQILSTFNNATGFHNILNPGDSILLFSAEASHNMHGPDGIRTLIPSDNQPITNNFTLGNFPTITPGILPQVAPTVYAEHVPLEIPIGTSNTLTPDVSQGTWTNSNPAVVTLTGNSITSDAIGSAILTFAPTGAGVPSSTIARGVAAAALSEVDYLIEYNENDCAYDCKMVVKTGVAIDPADRIQLGANYSIVVPSDVTISGAEITNDAPAGVSWNLMAGVLSPASDPDHNFYHIAVNNPTNAMHDVLVPGDTVTLFQIDLPYEFHGQDGIRNFINGSDLVGNPVMMDNFMNIGNTTTQLYQNNLQVSLPTVFAELSGNNPMLVGETAILTPATSDYSSSNLTVATISGNTITAVGVGTTIITYSPASGCSSDILLTVENNTVLDDVKYKIEFDETTCLYNCFLVAENGNALSQTERLKLASTYSIAIPKDVNIVSIQSVAPSTMSWEIGDSIIMPVSNPLMNFYQVVTDVTPMEFYDPIYQGDEVLLFTIELDANVYGECGFRNFVNGQDPQGNMFSIDNDFNIGGQIDIFSGSLPFSQPAGVATALDGTIDIGSSTTVTPAPGSGGTWTTNGSTAASFDPVTNTVTGFAEGSILLTYDDGQGCESSVVVKIENPPHDPVSEVDYLVKFNETTCEYDCFMKVVTGTALTQFERTLFGGSFSLVTPTETNLNFEESGFPADGTDWDLNTSEIAPVNDPDHNYYNITVNAPAGTFDFLYPNDEVFLFSISTDDNLHGPEGIRIFDNLTDPANVVQNIQNQFNLGTVDNDYQDNLPIEFPAVFAEAPNGTDINTSFSTQLTPSTGGTWTSSNVNIVQVTSNGLATGYGDGSAILTYTPDDATICESSVVLNVTTLPHDQVTEVDYQLKFNDTTCYYEAFLEVITGSAITLDERIQLASSFTVKVPKEISVQFIESISPLSTTWFFNQSELSPVNDPEFNYYHFISDATGANQHDFLNPGDEVHLFTISTSSNLHNDDRIRIYDNILDMGNTVNSMQNEFNLGLPIPGSDDYRENKPPVLPAEFTDVTIDSIFIEQTSTATSTIAGTWSSNDVSIATVDPNTGLITGVSVGTAIITLTPTDSAICPSSALIHVVPHAGLSEVDYKLVWDETTDEYVAYLIAVTGNAITQNERLKLASTFSIVTPDLVTPTITSTTPSATSWQIFEQIMAPASDPLHNFHRVGIDLNGPAEFYDVILEGDQVELFRISLDYNVHGVNGLRIFNNDIDLLNNPVDIRNDFNIGSSLGIFEDVDATVPPALFADTDIAYEIVEGTTTNAIPTGIGTWTNSDPSVATRDANGLITGLTVGNTILTFDPNNGDAPSSIIIYVTPDLNSVISAVEFKIEPDPNTCGLYNCYMVITEGSAYTPVNLIQGNALYTIKTPADVSISFNESVNPTNTTWSTGPSLLAPPEDPTHNFFSFDPALNGSVHSPLVEGQEVLLFTVNATNTVQGPKGIVLFNNDNDLPNNSLSFLNGMTIGGITQIYDGNQAGEGVGEYAEAIGPTVIEVGGQTTIIPDESTGTWAISDPAIASLDAGVVTGLSLGTTLFTFTPNDGSLCTSSVSISVETTPTAVAGVSVGTQSLSPSAIFEVYSTEKGFLVPRMTQDQRLCIASPADGLLVFQLDNENGFYYFNGSSWTRLDDVISAGTSNFTDDETNAAMQTNYNEIIKLLQTQQDELELKLSEQDALIIKLQEIIDNQ